MVNLGYIVGIRAWLFQLDQFRIQNKFADTINAKKLLDIFVYFQKISKSEK
jgi:hypothetical protein